MKNPRAITAMQVQKPRVFSKNKKMLNLGENEEHLCTKHDTELDIQHAFCVLQSRETRLSHLKQELLGSDRLSERHPLFPAMLSASFPPFSVEGCPVPIQKPPTEHPLSFLKQSEICPQTPFPDIPSHFQTEGLVSE